jgi:hypothetical protein
VIYVSAKEIKVTPSNKAILEDQLHVVKRTLQETAFYPAHDLRKESPEYARVHRKLVEEENRSCIVCGVTYTILKDDKKRADPQLNPYGAKQMETHHRIVEWALANAIDPDKFSRRILTHLRKQYPDHYPKATMTTEEVRQWVDHNEDNLWVLCDVHHRGKTFGIHSISNPIWGPQDILLDDFKVAVLKALGKAK